MPRANNYGGDMFKLKKIVKQIDQFLKEISNIFYDHLQKFKKLCTVVIVVKIIRFWPMKATCLPV